MKRSTWLAVLVTAAVLVVAGNLPRLPLDALATSWRSGLERSVAAWPHLARRTQAVAPATSVGGPRSQAPRPLRRPLTAYAPPRLLATPRGAQTGPRVFGMPVFKALPLQVGLPALAGVLAGLMALGSFALATRRDRRGHVWQLARRGLSPARIARSARLPQDAVRTLLTPGLRSRR